MAKKIGNIVLLWLAIIGAYILLANIFPVFTTLTYEAQAETVASTANATSRVGAVEFMGMMPLLIWFIPGLLGVIATVVYVKSSDDTT